MRSDNGDNNNNILTQLIEAAQQVHQINYSQFNLVNDM